MAPSGRDAAAISALTAISSTSDPSVPRAQISTSAYVSRCACKLIIECSTSSALRRMSVRIGAPTSEASASSASVRRRRLGAGGAAILTEISASFFPAVLALSRAEEGRRVNLTSGRWLEGRGGAGGGVSRVTGGSVVILNADPGLPMAPVVNDENVGPQVQKRGGSLKMGLGGSSKLSGGPARRAGVSASSTLKAPGTPHRSGLAPTDSPARAMAPSTPNVMVRSSAATVSTPGSRTGDTTMNIVVTDADVGTDDCPQSAGTAELPREQRQVELAKVYKQAIKENIADRAGIGVRIWIEYAQLEAENSPDDGRQVFNHMKSKGIGRDDAAFYVARAELEAADGDERGAQDPT